jgi:hypothetical protein
MPNQTPPELEAKILEMTKHYPTMSYPRMSSQLKLVGSVSRPRRFERSGTATG